MGSMATLAQTTLLVILCQIAPLTVTEATTSLQTFCQAPATTTSMTLQKWPHPVLCGESDHLTPEAQAANCFG